MCFFLSITNISVLFVVGTIQSVDLLGQVIILIFSFLLILQCIPNTAGIDIKILFFFLTAMFDHIFVLL